MKMANSKFLFIIIFAAVALVSITVGFSYAYVIRGKAITNTVGITTGTFGSNITYTKANFTLNAMSDVEGMAQSDYGKININSTDNDYNSKYMVGIGYNTTALPTGKSTSDLIPLEFVRAAIYTLSGSTLSSTPIAGPFAITDMPILSVDGSSLFKDLYAVYTGISNSSSTNALAIKFWLDDDTPISYNEKLVYLDANVEEQAKYAQNEFSLAGIVKNTSGTAVNGAVITVDGKAATKATSDSGGAFTISDGIYEGTHLITIDYGSVHYMQVVNIAPVTTTETFNKVTSSLCSETSGTAIQSKAYTCYANVSSILMLNSSLTNSNVVPSASYTVPTSYTLKANAPLAGDTSDLADISFQMNTNGTITIS